MLKRTPLYEEHKKLGARLIDFGGWEMPVQYTTVIDEHNTTRNNVTVFDICHMGELVISGEEAFELLQRVLTKDIANMEVGQIHLSVMCKPDGGILDDLTVYRMGEKEYMLVVNAGTTPKDFAWLKKAKEDFSLSQVELKDVSNETAKIDLQGPDSEKVLAKLTEVDLGQIGYYSFLEGEVEGVKMIISRSGYTGEDGFELYMPEDKAVKVWQAILEAGEEYGIKPAGLGARDTLRLECGMMLYGNDIDEEHTPIEGVYGWVVDLDKDFIGKSVLKKQKEEGVERKLIRFELLDRGIPRHHYEIYDGEELIGQVTSGTLSPTLGKSIGMGYVKSEYKEVGTKFEVSIRGRKCKAQVVKSPFYKRDK